MPELFMFYHRLYFTGALQWELPVFKLVPSVWTLLRRQNIKQKDERIDSERGAEMKGCGVPSKGNVGAREHAYSQRLIVPLSLLVAKGAVFKVWTQETWQETDCRSDVSSSHPQSSAHCGITFYKHLWTLSACTTKEVRIYRDGVFV